MSDWYFIVDITDPATFRAIWRAIAMMNRFRNWSVFAGILNALRGKV
jgi:hypothetical protein